MAISLNLQSSFNFDSGDDIAFDRSTGNLFLGRNSRVQTGGNRQTDIGIEQVTTSGQIINSFLTDELTNIIGLDFLPNGNLLVLSARDQHILEYTKDGRVARDGLNIVSNEIFIRNVRVLSGISYSPTTNTIFATDFQSSPNIFELDTSGKLVSVIDLSAKLPNVALQGITTDPLTGNFLVSADDRENLPSNTIYEITRSGDIVSTIDIKALTGFADPEGLTIDSATRTLYVVFDNDDTNGDPVYSPSRNHVAAFKIEVDTFTGDTGTNDTITGDATANTFLGGSGNDYLLGSQGNDILYGGLDNDTINGNQGDDQVFGGAGDDLARGGDGNDYISGSSGNDTLFGDRGNDNIQAGSGNDIVNANQGSDILNGNEGNDLLRGGRDNDTISGDQGDDTLYGDEGFDNLLGGEGNDSLLGGSGEDTLNGGVGIDTLNGGASRDTFVVAIGGGADVITDFVVGVDLIGLTGGLTFGQLTLGEEVVNNKATSFLRLSATGEIVATIEGVPTISLGSNIFVSV